MTRSPEDIVRSLVLRTGLRMPRVMLYERGSPNAFGTWFGRGEIYVHRGLLALPESQLEAILAHELGHLVHRDWLWIGIARLVAAALSVVAWFYLPVWQAVTVVAGAWACHGIIAYCSEYAADLWAVRHCGAKMGMLQWLCKRNSQAWYSLHPSPRSRIDRILQLRPLVPRSHITHEHPRLS